MERKLDCIETDGVADVPECISGGEVGLEHRCFTWVGQGECELELSGDGCLETGCAFDLDRVMARLVGLHIDSLEPELTCVPIKLEIRARETIIFTFYSDTLISDVANLRLHLERFNIHSDPTQCIPILKLKIS